MQVENTAAVLISGMALLLSIVATVISIHRKKRESQRIIRSQLTDVLSRIVSTNLESIKLQHRKARKNPEYYNAIVGILSQQSASLLQQALYLIEQIPGLVASIEYGTIATANLNAGDIIQAENYYQKAIQVASNEYYRSLAIRNYGLFLFQHHRFEEARDQYRKSISCLKGSDNLIRYTNGTTYKFWAINELNFAKAPKRAEELFESARTEFNAIDHEVTRSNFLQLLESDEKQYLSLNGS